MANEIQGERAQCPCHREGWITERSNALDVPNPWWRISHEGGLVHEVTRVWLGDRFRFMIRAETA